MFGLLNFDSSKVIMPLRRLSNAELNRVVGMIQGGRSQRETAQYFNVSHSVIGRCWARFVNNNSVNYTHGGGGRRVTTPRTDRILGMTVRRNPLQNSTNLRNFLRDRNVLVSASTVKRRLYARGLHAYRPFKHPRISAANRANRLNWAREHVNWGLQQWGYCLFADESRICLSPDDNRIRVWRARGERFLEGHGVERVNFGGGSLTVWGSIYRGGRSQICVFINQTVNSQRYLQILQQHVPPVANIIGPHFIYVDDNARPHRAAVVNDFFEQNNLSRMDWPPTSPDANPIEHIWDYLKRKIKNRPEVIVNLQQLQIIVEEEWNEIPQNIIDNVIDSLPNRCQAIIQSRGGPTHY